MLIYKGMVILSFSFLVEGMKSKSDRSRMLFYKMSGKILNASQIKEIEDLSPEDCMVVCMDDERCKAFTAFRGSSASPPRCVFYAQDVCDKKTTLLHHPSADYFDTNGDGKCPESSE